MNFLPKESTESSSKTIQFRKIRLPEKNKSKIIGPLLLKKNEKQNEAIYSQDIKKLRLHMSKFRNSFIKSNKNSFLNDTNNNIRLKNRSTHESVDLEANEADQIGHLNVKESFKQSYNSFVFQFKKQSSRQSIGTNNIYTNLNKNQTFIANKEAIQNKQTKRVFKGSHISNFKEPLFFPKNTQISDRINNMLFKFQNNKLGCGINKQSVDLTSAFRKTNKISTNLSFVFPIRKNSTILENNQNEKKDREKSIKAKVKKFSKSFLQNNFKNKGATSLNDIDFQKESDLFRFCKQKKDLPTKKEEKQNFESTINLSLEKNKIEKSNQTGIKLCSSRNSMLKSSYIKKINPKITNYLNEKHNIHRLNEIKEKPQNLCFFKVKNFQKQSQNQNQNKKIPNKTLKHKRSVSSNPELKNSIIKSFKSVSSREVIEEENSDSEKFAKSPNLKSNQIQPNKNYGQSIEKNCKNIDFKYKRRFNPVLKKSQEISQSMLHFKNQNHISKSNVEILGWKMSKNKSKSTFLNSSQLNNITLRADRAKRKQISASFKIPTDEVDEKSFEKSLALIEHLKMEKIQQYKAKAISQLAKMNESQLISHSKFYFYHIEHLLDKGAYGKVFLGRSVLTNSLVAIKCFESGMFQSSESFNYIAQEINLMKIARHENIIQLFDFFRTENYLFVVMEYAPHGNLLSFIQENGIFSESEFQPIFNQIAQGLFYLHKNRILHRDVKLENILIAKNKQIKICDFGISRYVSEGTIIDEHIGTPAYIAPEVLLENGYSEFKVDIWSLGVLSYIALTGEIPFDGESIEELRESILKKELTFPKEIKLSESTKSLISQMLVKKPENRLDIHGVFKFLSLIEQGGEVLNRPLDELKIKKIESFGVSHQTIVDSVKKRKFNQVSALYDLLV